MNVSRSSLAVALCAGLFGAPAWAVLGGAPSAATATAASPDAPAPVVRSAGAGATAYQIQQSQTPAGTRVREYVDAQGKVFCVAWDGPQIPDLPALFGDYYARYVDYLRERRDQGVRGPVRMQAETLVVESGGRMRAFAGRAYVPALLPAGVALETLQ